MFRIGTVNIDTSHAPSFAEILQKGDVARYTCVYNDGFRTDEEVDAFITRFGLEKRYTSLEEMAGNVDIAFIQGCDWDRHLALAEPSSRRACRVHRQAHRRQSARLPHARGVGRVRRGDSGHERAALYLRA